MTISGESAGCNRAPVAVVSMCGIMSSQSKNNQDIVRFHLCLRMNANSKTKDFHNPSANAYSDADSEDDDRQRTPSRSQSRQSSVTGSKDVEMLVGELTKKAGGGNVEGKDAKMLAIVFAAMVVVGLGNKVFQKLMTIPMKNYPNFLNLLTTFVYLPTSFAYIIPAIKSGRIPKEQAEMGKKPFFVMGFLDAVAGIMQVFAATYLPGPLLILLGQAAIPMSMVISKYLLKREYTRFQYIGAFIVALGIATVLIPSMSGGGSAGWAIVMIFSTVPMALSSVYKEIALGETELDPIFLNGWIAVFQFMFSCLICIPAAYTSEPPISISELPKNLYDGLLCFGGVNSVTCAAGTDDGECVPDDCYSRAPVLVSVYLVFNQIYNLLIILIIKYGSSNLLFMALTVMVPLGNFAFTLPFVPGHAPLKPTDVIGLLIICGGLVCYRFATVIITKYCGGKLCGYVVPSDDSDTSALENGGLDTNPLLKQYLTDDAISEGDENASQSASGSMDSRYSVSKVAKEKRRAKSGDSNDDDSGVSLPGKK